MITSSSPASVNGKEFISIRIINGARQRLPIQPTCNRNCIVGNSIKKIHRAVNRIHHPLILTRGCRLTPFLPQKSILGINLMNLFSNLLLNSSIELELNVVLLSRINLEHFRFRTPQDSPSVTGDPLCRRTQRLKTWVHLGFRLSK